MREWVKQNIADFNNAIVTEEDVKVKIALPYLQTLGYSISDMQFEKVIPVQVGNKKPIPVRADIVVVINGKVEMVVDTKSPRTTISDKEILQATSYAKLISTPPALIAVTTNGLECVVTNISTGQRFPNIPTRNQLVIDVSRARNRLELTDIQIREVRSVLLTLYSEKELYSIINLCKSVIEKRALIRNDQSFKEMTKILLVKMNEERRATQNLSNRFDVEYIESQAKLQSVDVIEIFKLLFDEAKRQFPVYSDPNEAIKIMDNASIVEIVKLLEPWSFLGTGDDIKGAVYEIFLKSTLRGDFDQYFTPREIVDYMVKFADPNMGDRIIDPACGSGGFLIQAFKYVNQKIIDNPASEQENKKRYKDLVDLCLWGHEADEDLHVLAKINLIMHGDGYNNIYQGDTLRSNRLPEDTFDIVFTNPPFTIPYTFSDVLSKYDMGTGKDSEELDILFVEKCINLVNSTRGGEIYIVLPEGLLNLKSYMFFREWLLSKCWLVSVVSLPEGAFIPFGKSVSKTTILALRKKKSPIDKSKMPAKVFLGSAREIGYETGKKDYRPHGMSDLSLFLTESKSFFEGIHETIFGGECGWIDQEEITPVRIDASYLLNLKDRDTIRSEFENVVPLGSIAFLDNVTESPQPGSTYYYLEIPDISPVTGVISNIRHLDGIEINSSMHVFHGGDIVMSRINPRKNRVSIIPDGIPCGLVSKEAYIIKIKDNPYISDPYVLCTLLQTDTINRQVRRLATGSSSSRARVYEDDLLDYVFIPVPEKSVQEKVGNIQKRIYSDYWTCSQQFLDGFIESHSLLMSMFNKNDMRSV